MLDLKIKGAMVYDGRGGCPYAADVGIKGERIATIGDLSEAASLEEIEARGLALLPGFIDPHTHSDALLFRDPQRSGALCQGVTTEFIGACGLGLLPLSRERFAEYEKFMRGALGRLPEGIIFDSVDERIRRLGQTGMNVAVQLPHSPVRLSAVGFLDVPLRGYALDKAKDMLRQGFEEGAVSFTTGLSYYPASFGDTEEVAALCKVAAEYDAPLCIHTRTALREPDPAFDPREEALEIARRSGVRLHFSHYRTEPRNAGDIEWVFDSLERGLSEGLGVTAEFYPYETGSSFGAFFLPMWSVEGGQDAIIKRLQDPADRRRIEAAFQQSIKPELYGVFTHLPEHPEYVGMSFESVAAERNQTVPQMFCDMMLEEALEVGFRGNACSDPAILEQMDRDFMAFMKKPYYMIGSDTLPGHMRPHPRSCGAFAKILRLAREHGLPLELLANRLSYLPARTFRLRDRGEIAEGRYADLVILDPGKASDTASYQNPISLPTGVAYVVVNGRLAVSNEKTTGVMAGYGLRREG